MKLVSAEVSNFASYKHLSLGFTNLGLCLINGATGSGKSTLCDIVPWILFGKTAKNGAVDEVRSWGSKNTTQGTVSLIGHNNAEITVTRTRHPNDLYIKVNGQIQRGKDLTDTQNIINNILGLDLETYLSGAYFHEFSQTATFFTANAKVRRAITDQLVDLSFHNALIERLSESKKIASDLVKALESDIKRSLGLMDESSFRSYQQKSKEWELNHYKVVEELRHLSDNFETIKADTVKELERKHLVESEEAEKNLVQLELSIIPDDRVEAALKEQNRLESLLTDEVCNVCGSKKDGTQRLELANQRHELELQIKENAHKQKTLISAVRAYEKMKQSYEQRILQEKNSDNKYLEQLTRLLADPNPYDDIVEDLSKKLESAKRLVEGKALELEQTQDYLADVIELLDAAGELRSILISNAIADLEDTSNRGIMTYFGGEFRVEYIPDGADKLQVVIHKDGYECSYTQLSKGQRQILKLTFGLAVMELIAKRYSVQFNTVFLDEALDGLDSDLKVKAYGLLTELATKYENVLVVEHSQELKGLFSSSINVKLVGGESEIEKA